MRGEIRFNCIIEFDRFESENIKQSIGKEENEEEDEDGGIRTEFDLVIVGGGVVVVKSSFS